MTLPEAIRRLMAGETRSLRITVGEVKSVDGTRCIVQPPEEAEILVRLRAAEDGEAKGEVATPAVGSQVAVMLLDTEGADAILVATTELEKWALLGALAELGTTGLEWAALGETLKAKLEELLDELSAILDAILALTVPTGVGPSGTPVNAASFTTSKTNLATLKSQLGDILSDQVKIGKA